jgi:hypothetical protein
MAEANTKINNSIKNPEEEKNKSVEIFQDSIVDFLSSTSELVMIAIDDYNETLIALLDSDPQFRKRLENALYENQQVLTGKKFVIENKPKLASVGNWLKDFIKQNGTDKFDNVVLTQFVSNSPNGRVLDQAEKDLLRKLLVLYRNLKYFPDSLKDLPVEDWQIIPAKRPVVDSPSRAKMAAEAMKEKGALERGGGSIAGEIAPPPAKPLIQRGSMPMPAKPEAAKAARPVPPPIRTPVMPKKPEIKKDPVKEQKLMELYREARNYPEGSIQRRAVEEEIEKINEE